jgi:hypothetical protein
VLSLANWWRMVAARIEEFITPVLWTDNRHKEIA